MMLRHSLQRISRVISSDRISTIYRMRSSTSNNPSLVPLPEGVFYLRLPSLMDTNVGTIDRWLKNEGESFGPSEPIAVVSIGDLTVGMNLPTHGVLTRILRQAGNIEYKSGEAIAVYAEDKDAMMSYIENERTLVSDKEMKAVYEEVDLTNKTKKPDTKSLVTKIKQLISDGSIQEGSDFAVKLLSLARNNNIELLNIFEASYEANNYADSFFDKTFFIENAADIVKEQNMIPPSN